MKFLNGKWKLSWSPGLQLDNGPFFAQDNNLLGKFHLDGIAVEDVWAKKKSTNGTAQEQLEQEEWDFPTKPWEIWVCLKIVYP